jgi:hypothetical protein
MKCPICLSMIKNCPFCKLDNTEMPEALIIIIQNINHNYTKEQRDNALIELTRRFQYLIKKIAGYFHKNIFLKNVKYEYNDLYQDVILEFYDLVINDFKIKEVGDNSLAVFGNYIKIKLYRRIQAKIQEQVRDINKIQEISTDFTAIDFETDGAFTKEIFEATLANILNIDELELDTVKHEKCTKILSRLYKISFQEKVCSKMNGEVWRLHWFSGKSTDQIDEYLISEMSYECKTGKSKIQQIVKLTNQKIIAEFGRLSALGDLDV